MISKPCARAPACTGLVWQKYGPAHFARTRFCSRRCAYLARKAGLGWATNRPIPLEAKRRGGKAGGVASGVLRRAEAALRTATRLEKFWVSAGVDREDLPRLKALLVRAWRAGYKQGYETGKHGTVKKRKVAA